MGCLHIGRNSLLGVNHVKTATKQQKVYKRATKIHSWGDVLLGSIAQQRLERAGVVKGEN